MAQLRIIHFTIGTLGLIAFLLTGQYMLWVHAGLQGMDDGPRLFFRSAHIYLLWSSLLNFVLGCYLTRIPAGSARHVQLISSILILLGPVALCISFFFEPYTPELVRPIGKWAIVVGAAGVVGQAGALALARYARRAASAAGAEGPMGASAPEGAAHGR